MDIISLKFSLKISNNSTMPLKTVNHDVVDRLLVTSESGTGLTYLYSSNSHLGVQLFWLLACREGMVKMAASPPRAWSIWLQSRLPTSPANLKAGIHNSKEYVTPDLESMVIAPSIFGLKELKRRHFAYTGTPDMSST